MSRPNGNREEENGDILRWPRFDGHLKRGHDSSRGSAPCGMEKYQERFRDAGSILLTNPHTQCEPQLRRLDTYSALQ